MVVILGQLKWCICTRMDHSNKESETSDVKDEVETRIHIALLGHPPCGALASNIEHREPRSPFSMLDNIFQSQPTGP